MSKPKTFARTSDHDCEVTENCGKGSYGPPKSVRPALSILPFERTQFQANGNLKKHNQIFKGAVQIKRPSYPPNKLEG